MNAVICHLLMLGIACSNNWDYVTLDDFYDRIVVLVRKDNITDEDIQEIVDEFELYPEYHEDNSEQSTK